MPEAALERSSSFVGTTTCSFCGTGCTLQVTVEDGVIVSVQGDKQSPVNRGESCVKGTQAWKSLSSDRRLKQPLVRKNGKLEPASWDEALTAVAEGLLSVRQKHGAKALGCLSSSRATNEVNFLAQKLMRQVFGSNNVDSCNRT